MYKHNVGVWRVDCSCSVLRWSVSGSGCGLTASRRFIWNYYEVFPPVRYWPSTNFRSPLSPSAAASQSSASSAVAEPALKASASSAWYRAYRLAPLSFTPGFAKTSIDSHKNELKCSELFSSVRCTFCTKQMNWQFCSVHFFCSVRASRVISCCGACRGKFGCLRTINNY